MANYTFHQTDLSEVLSPNGLGDWVFNSFPKREVDYAIATHYHPYVDALIEQLNVNGLPTLLDATYQKSLEKPLAPKVYAPGPYATGTFPLNKIDEDDDGAYALYNWELFFHAPVLIATHLSKNQRFEEAQLWFHFVFDPTSDDVSVPVPQRFWKFLRFREETTPEFIATLLTELAKGTDSGLCKRIEAAIQGWRDKPFQPHVIARGRALAYQTNVVMKYLDNLLAWGDFLFRQDTIETMNEATQIYLLAANLLGPKPQPVPPRGTPPRLSYGQLKQEGIDAFGNALVEMENDFPFTGSAVGDVPGDPGTGSAFGIGRSLYFCIPPNDRLLGYWDE